MSCADMAQVKIPFDGNRRDFIQWLAALSCRVYMETIMPLIQTDDVKLNCRPMCRLEAPTCPN